MPSLPFTYEDLRNHADTADPLTAPMLGAVGSIDGYGGIAAKILNKRQRSNPVLPTVLPKIDPQEFLDNAVSRVKKQLGSTEGLIDTGLALNPVTRVVDMGAKFFDQPGIQEGFIKGTTMTGDVNVPRMPF